MKIEKTPRGYLLSANGGNRIEFYREFNGVEAWACAAFDELMNERDTVRAKIAEMEQQKPIAEWIENRFHRYPQLNWADGYRAVIGEKLYALPSAKGEEK